jgi:folate-binding protein YgfZ
MCNPLYPLHQQAQAEFQSWDEMEIVSTFGEPQAEYAAIRKAAGMMDLPQRGVLELKGKDRLSFLNSILSAQTWDKETKQPMPAGRWVYSFLLNLKGRIVTDMNVLELGDRTLIEMDRGLVEPLRAVLEAYHFAEQVKMVNRSDELHEIAIHGPGAGDALTSAAKLSPGLGEPQSCAGLQMLGYDIVAWRDDPTGSPGLHLLVPSAGARAVWMHMITTLGQVDAGKRRLRPIGWAAFNATRIEAGRPIFGIDFEGVPIATAFPSRQQREQGPSADATLGMLPAETGQLQRAVSLTKCYIGQEIVARMHARGQMARKIVGIRMEGDALPLAGSEIFDDAGNIVGVVTSSTNSPVLSNLAICLGTVKRPFMEPGSALRIPAEGTIHHAAVAATPFIPAV